MARAGSTSGNPEAVPVRACGVSLLIAATPVAFALTSWTVMFVKPELLPFVNRYSMPVMIAEILVVLWTLASGASPLSQIGSWTLTARIAATMFVGLIWGTAFLVAPDRGNALIGAFGSTMHLLVGLAVASGLRAPPWQPLLYGLLGFLLVVMVFAIAPKPPGYDWVLFGIAASNARHLGYYAAAGALIALGLATGSGTWPRWRYVVAAALFAAFALWTGSRGAIIAVIAALPLAALASSAFRRVDAAIAWAIALAAGLAVAAPLPVPTANFGLARVLQASAARDSGLDQASSGRLSLWRGAITGIRRRPLFGHGENQFRSQVPEASGRYNHPHDSVLQILFQWGIVGLGLIGLFLVLLARPLESAIKAAPEATAPALALLTGLLVFSLYDGTLYYPYPIMLIATALATIMTASTQAGTRLR